jgi:Arc/MetJ-type ribon-helix-helix transcriptional regulator
MPDGCSTGSGGVQSSSPRQTNVYILQTYAVGHSYVKKGQLGIRVHGTDGHVNEDSEKITLRLPKRFLRALDFLVEMDDFPSRSEAVRAAIRDLVYARVELVGDRLKKLEEAEKALANIEALKRQYMKS